MSSQIKSEVPTKQWAQVFEKAGGPILYKQIDVPKPGPNEVLINVKICTFCKMTGRYPPRRPIVGGHEGVGQVVARGELVKDPPIGAAVGIKWLNSSCGHCEYCLTGWETFCSSAALSGFTVDGSFQQYAVANAEHVARIPEGVPLDAVAPILCAGITVYKALKVSEAKPGQWVAIPGAGGGLGSLAIQYAKAMGLRVIAIDTGDAKAKLCSDSGAEKFLDFTSSKDLVKDIQDMTGGGPHAVVVTAAANNAISQACQYVRTHGVVLNVGLPAKGQIIADTFWLTLRGVTLRGSYVGTRADTQEALDFYARGLIKVPFTVRPLSELRSIYDDLIAGKIAGRVVSDNSK